MIRRFKLETEGTSRTDCEAQIDAAIDEILDLEGTMRDDWEITDFVTWKAKEAKHHNGYCARVVLKRKERDE